MTDEQLLKEVKKIFPNHELGKPLDYKEFKKHEHELFDLLSNEIKNRGRPLSEILSEPKEV